MVVPVAPGEQFFEQVDSLSKLDALINWKTINILYLKIYCHYSCGKIFAHWTKECQELIAGKHTPVFSLKRKAEQQDIEVRKLPSKNSIISVGVLQNAHSCMDQHCFNVFGN